MKHFHSKSKSVFYKTRRGEWGQAHAVRWLRTQGFQVIGESLRVSYDGGREWGSGEIDILATKEPAGELWIVEVKTRSAVNPFVPLINRAQSQRLQRAAKILMLNREVKSVRIALLLVRQPSGEVEFLVNPW